MGHHKKATSREHEKNTSKLVDFLMEDVTIDKIKNPFLTKEKIHLQLQELLGADRIRQRIKHGITVLFDDLPGHLSQPDMQQVHHECHIAIDTIITMVQEKGPFGEMAHKLEELPDHLQGILHLSETTYQHFYESGNRFFQAQRFQDASDIFFLLSILNSYKSHVMIALGLTEAHLHKYQDALQAFATAAILDPASPYPHIYSAQCYQEIKDEQNKKDALDDALHIIEEHPTPESEKMKAYIVSLNNS